MGIYKDYLDIIIKVCIPSAAIALGLLVMYILEKSKEERKTILGLIMFFIFGGALGLTASLLWKYEVSPFNEAFLSQQSKNF
jgi:hypothetical protein